MKYIKTMTQLKLSIWLALYIGWFMNAAVFFRRFEGYAQEFTIWKGLSGAVELIGTFLVTFFLLRILSLFGRRVWRILATIVVLFSAAASYYMTFLNVVIGYGIIASVMTTDIDLSREVIGWHLILWLVLMSALPLVLIWSNRCRFTLLRQIRTPGQRMKNITIVLLAGLMVWGLFACWRFVRRTSSAVPKSICQAMAGWWLTPICRLTGYQRWGFTRGRRWMSLPIINP
jgi:KDO II ethanolaminephosphotransferase